MIHQRLFPLEMSKLTVAPVFSTNITIGKSGAESRQQNWQHPRRKYNAGTAVRTLEQLRTLKDFHLSTRGPLTAFLIQDFTDFAVTEWTGFAENVTGSQQNFQLFKKYTDSSNNTYTRNIFFPGGGSVALQKNGVDVNPADFSVNLTTGIVTYNAGTAGATVTFKISLFYVPVRFVNDELPTDLVEYYLLSGIEIGKGDVPEIPLIEVRYETVTSLEPYFLVIDDYNLVVDGNILVI